MKKILYVLMFALIVVFLSSVAAMAVDQWVTANSATIAWDAVTEATDGGPLAEGAIVEYEVFVAKENLSGVVSVWRGSETTAVITLPKQGRFMAGIKTWLVVDGLDEAESPTVWSNDPLIVANATTFGFVYFKNPKHPMNLRK